MRSTAQLAVYFAVLAFGTYQTFAPGFDSRFTRMQSERGDGMLNHYILEHTWQCVSNPDYCGSLFSPPCFFPEPFTLWYSEHFLGVAPAYWGLRLVLPYDLAYHWWQILTNALNFIAFAVVVRWLRGSHILAILGGYLWAFALAHIDQMKHQQMIPRFWMPLAAYYAWSFALVPTTRSLNRILCFVFLQCIVCVYTGWFLVLSLGVFLPLAIAVRPGAIKELWQFVRKNRYRVLAIVGVWGGALAVAFVPYLIINWGMSRTYDECFGLMPTPSAWFTGPPGSRWEQTTAPFRQPVQGESYLFCGFGVYALLLAASADLLFFRRSNRSDELSLASAGLLTAAICALATMTPFDAGPSLWKYVRHIPGGGAIRCVTRVYVVVYLFGLLSSIVWLNAITVHLRPWIRMMILGPIAAVLIFEQTGYDPPSFDKTDFYTIADRVAVQLQGADAGYVVSAFTDTKGQVSTGVYGDVMGMWAGMRANVPVVNGYSGRWPSGNYPYAEVATDDMLRAWLRGRFHGTLAIVDPDHPEALRTIWIE